MSETIEYIVYYKSIYCDLRTYNSLTKTFETVHKLPKTISNFYLLKNYMNTDEDLIRFCNDMRIATDQIKTKIGFDYIAPYKNRKGEFVKARSHYANIEMFFKYITHKSIYSHHEQINNVEAKWMSKTFNGGLTYIKPGTYQAHGYDFSNYYGNILGTKSDFVIPCRPGREQKITKLPVKIKFGFYNIIVKSDDENFNKVFEYSKHNVYTSNDIRFIRVCQETMKITIDINMDCEKNAYIYNKDSLNSPHVIFQHWFKKIIELKKEFPKNMLLKCLSSTLWGVLSKSNCRTVSEEEGDKMNIGLDERAEYILKDFITGSNGKSSYVIIPSERQYYHPFRFKSFITSYARTKIALIALNNIDNVIKIQTDSIVYDKEIQHNIKTFIPDPKSTGLIQFINMNKKIIIEPS